MTYRKQQVRQGMTAIAAVLALSSTPSLAQDATAAPDPATETAAEPPAVTEPQSTEPAAQEPAASEPAPAEETAAEPVAAKVPATKRASTPAKAQARTRAAIQPAPATVPASAAPVAEAPAGMQSLPPVAAPVMEPAPVPAEQPAGASGSMIDEDVIPIAAGAGLGLLALTGIGLGMRRRRRRDEDERAMAAKVYLDEHPAEPFAHEPSLMPVRQPAMAAAALPESKVLADAPTTRLPEGFDLSRFGPHVRAAYMGPTPDNPSLSLRNRLRRASAMDQRARIEGEARPSEIRPAEPVAAKRPQPAAQPAWSMSNEGFMLRRATASEKQSVPATEH